jgi:hypothetical protein
MPTKNIEIGLHVVKKEVLPGWTVIISRKNYFTQKPGRTAHHEGLHTVAAIKNGSKVIEASREPGPGSLGHTLLGRYDRIAFMAAHAHGCDGTGHDVSVVRFMGDNPESAASSARQLLMNQEEEIYAVSSLIEEKGTITGEQAVQALDKVANPEADIEVIGPNGEKRSFVTKTRKGKNFFISIGLPENLEQQKNKKNQKIENISDYRETPAVAA